MANTEHLELLKQGVEVWNQWRARYPEIQFIDLGGVDLKGADLSGADLKGAWFGNTKLSGANLSKADLSTAKFEGNCLYGLNLREAKLYEADLRYVDLREANLREANLRKADLRHANLIGLDLSEFDLSEADLRDARLSDTQLHRANLHGANLSRIDLSQFNLCDANLSGADLSRAQFLGTNFSRAIFTGACLENWNINSSTNFDGAICEYIYLKANQKERRPREGTFKPGEFAALFQQAIDTVDLIFVDGLDWQSFFASLQEIRHQYDGAEINIQAIEKKSGGAFVVRLEASDSLDKADLQRRLTTAYEENQQLRSQLLKTEGKLEGYKEQLDDFQQKVLQGMNSPKYDLRGAQIAGGVADTVQGDQVGGAIHNEAAETLSLTEVVAEIQNLLKHLEASNPNATEAEQIAYLSAMVPLTNREQFIGALKSAGAAAIDEIPYSAVLKALVEGRQKAGG